MEIEDILRSSDSLLEKNLKVFVLLLLSSNSLEKKRKYHGKPGRNCGQIYSNQCIGSLATHLYLRIHAEERVQFCADY